MPGIGPLETAYLQSGKPAAAAGWVLDVEEPIPGVVGVVEPVEPLMPDAVRFRPHCGWARVPAARAVRSGTG